MSEIMKKASSPQVLNQCWRRLKKDNAPWAPGVCRREMETDLVYHLMTLSEELRNGTYRPHATRFFTVEKGDGKQRIISAVTLRDKTAQRAVLSVLAPMAEKKFHHCSYGYRPGRTVDMAVSKAREHVLCGLDWMVDADIEQYFDNISHQLLVKRLKGWIKDKAVVELIKNWLDVGTPRKGFFSTAKGIPQGAVISPFLCNVYLTDFDFDMADRNLPMVRFADDFIVFTRSRKDAEIARTYVERSLKRLDLELNAQKTRVTRCGPHVVFLGRKMPKSANGKRRLP